MNLAPIALFVYNRPWHTQQVVEALQRCELAKDSDLYVFADGPKTDTSEDCKNRIAEVRKYIRSITGFANVTISEAERNIGCADSIINGVSQVIERYGRVIVVEDDIKVHPFFLRFMNAALEMYAKDNRIFCVSATMENFPIPKDYDYDVFLTYRSGSWGWGTWENRWKMNNWDINSYLIIKQPTKRRIRRFCRGGDDLWPMLLAQYRGEIDAWDVRYCYNMSILNRFCLRPVRSLTVNIGMDNSGTHCGEWEVPLLPLYDKEFYRIVMPDEIVLDREITKSIQTIFQQEEKSSVDVKWLKRKIKKALVRLNLMKVKA